MGGQNTFVNNRPVRNAGDVPVTPAGGISATTVQAAIEELDTEKMSIADPQVSNDVADTTLSGTPKIFSIKDSAGTPYYFKAYPTKA